MKTRRIAVNKTAEKPGGVEIEIVEPENLVEQRVLSFLLSAAIREIKRTGNMGYSLPDNLVVEYSKEGSFVVQSPAGTAGVGFYQAGRPLAVVGVHVNGQRIDLVHAEIKAG